MHKSQREVRNLIISGAAAILLAGGAHGDIDDKFDVLPFKNNIDKNIEYGQNLYEFGNRDHTTVMHSYVRVQAMLEETPLLHSEINEIRECLVSQYSMIR